jgi:hypothetical protein
MIFDSVSRPVADKLEVTTFEITLSWKDGLDIIQMLISLRTLGTFFKKCIFGSKLNNTSSESAPRRQ